jgi:molybdopterin-guanine dinucleotide biosynthesis protein A
MTPDRATAVSAIVLAGGRSSRFGSDKLAATIDGMTLLDRAIAALDAVASEIVVVVAPGDRRAPTPLSRPLRIVADHESYAGPLVGLLVGLETVAEPLVIVAAGDMPALRPDVLRLMTGTLRTAEPGVDAVVLGSRGDVVPLPAALRVGAATDVARRLIGDGERRLRTLFDRLSTRVLADGEWRPLDPSGDTLRDVDRQEDVSG